LVYLLEAFFKVLDEEMRDRCDESKKGVYNIEYTISKDFYAPGVRRLKDYHTKQYVDCFSVIFAQR
jgi:hypothetical protein